MPKPSKAVKNRGLRQTILEAAVDLVESDGIEALTQPRLAALLGLRQSHLTYYFPRKSDLVLAVLQNSHDRALGQLAATGDPASFDTVMRLLEALIFDRRRMRFFLGIVYEASDNPGLRAVLAAHARGLVELVAPVVGRGADDPDVLAFVDFLRGLGIRRLIDPTLDSAPAPDVETLATRFGLGRGEAGNEAWSE